MGKMADMVLGISNLECGSPMPLGSHVLPVGVNFAVFAGNATRVWLAFFQPDEEKPCHELELDPLVTRTGDVWHVMLDGLGAGVRYAWRAQGPEDANKEIHRYDPTAYLVDPYAMAVTGGEQWGNKVLTEAMSAEGGRHTRLRSLVVENSFDWEGDRPINRSLRDSVIYEMHVRGFTKHPSAGVKHPGTYHGLVEKIPYLQKLGITAVELLPVAEFIESQNVRINPDTGEGLVDYWGYNPLSYFAPKAAYASDGHEGRQVNEFRWMVKEMHRAGIEVILDVVFNHTAEGDHRGPTLSFRGLDNEVYYILGENGEYHNYSGCGNTLKCNHPVVRDFVVDCLRYWVAEMHVDGFRFDLASILGRGRNGEVLSNPPLVERIAGDPVLARTKVIAEAWDAAGLYQVGNFPSWGRWAEWNGKYRDDIRSFVKGTDGMVQAFATRVSGSSDLYSGEGRGPGHSVNFITSHDGFPLWDLVSFNGKHNLSNGENNQDGDNHNESWNHGVEGETDDPEVLAFRRRQVKNFYTILLISQGVPMVLAGDELLRTQRGNNNTYCQDNELNWLDWTLEEKNADHLRFCQEMIKFRLRHPVLRRDRHFAGQDHDGNQLPDISWHGTRMGKPDWGSHSRSLAFLLDGSEADDFAPDEDIFVAVNCCPEKLMFNVPYYDEDRVWRRVVDTSKDSPRDFIDEDRAPILKGQRFRVMEHSVVILVSRFRKR